MAAAGCMGQGQLQWGGRVAAMGNDSLCILLSKQCCREGATALSAHLVLSHLARTGSLLSQSRLMACSN